MARRINLRWISVTAALAASLVALVGHAGIGRSVTARSTSYARSARLSAPIESTADGAQNLYPVASQSAAVAAMARRLADKRPLVVQGEQLAGQGGGSVERFAVVGEVVYDVEVAVVRSGVELTPPVRAAVEDAVRQVSREAVNIQRVVVDARTITVETDAGPRVLMLTVDHVTPGGSASASRSAGSGDAGRLAM